ncbi:S8 family serine peptidase [Neobacillus sp. FSL H8-0543]|uniref:S8 family serine peptidase n=1 Tax=Neobacillus sp. FSL H8-0543 TaxID=2954672 RepID=UPI0031581A28
MVKKNHGKKRKIATYALASALVLSNFAAVAPTSAATYKPGDLDSKVKQLLQQKSKASATTKAAKVTSAKANLKASDKVRVIVEVEGQTPVEFATKEGVLYKELSEDKKSSLSSKLESQQKSVKDKIASKGVKVQYKQKFSTAFNGFSGEVAYGDVAKIEAVAGVKNVYLANEYNRPEIQPNMKTSHQFVQAKETWANSGFKGEGMVVAVIDSGIDPSHKDFKLTTFNEEGLSKTEVNQLVQENGLKGKFYTDKVPYAYNYYDQNSTILDLGPEASMHGMHVAGTVVANGDEANGGIKGVAPEAQVLGMKVFSNDPLYPSTWSDIYLAAIDDSIKLGADVLNMSLGSTASFYDENSAEDLAIQRAVANGIVSAVSAGNSNHIGDGWDNPYAQNPDIGVVGAPGLNPDTISVAASGNQAYLFQHNLTIDGVEGSAGVGYGIDDWSQLEGSLELVSLGDKIGAPADYNGLDVKGKVVVVPRGSLTFFDKTVNAAAAGAAGIIVWNKTNGFFFDNQGGWDVPFMMVSKAEGEAINAAIAAGKTTVHASQLNKTDSPEMGRMTAFTSWGTTPSLEMKPELTAPGGNIYSTVNDNKYTVMSGTSMAAPHVAGGSALVQQYLQTDARFGDLSVAERTALAKVLLMNTASVIDDLNGQPFSPRRQGAGMMQLQSAVTTPVYVVNKADGEAKVELKDFQEKQFEMNFTAQNISDKDVTYTVNTDVLTDTIQSFGEDIPEYNALIAGDLAGAVVDAPETVTVPAGGTAEFTVKVNFADAKIPGLDADGNKTTLDLREDIFVEGSVALTSESAPSLTVPYVGFFGKWDNPEIVDGFKGLGEDRFYDLDFIFGEGVPEVTDAAGEFTENLIPEKNVYALSPNGDGIYEDINPIPSFLRNAAEVQYNILDKDGNQLRRVKAEADVVKNAFDSANLGTAFSWRGDRVWDGKVKGEVVKDGLYYYEIKSVIDYAGAKWQSKKIPVLVDTTAPKVKAIYDEKKTLVSWEASDEGSGTYFYLVFVNGGFVAELDGTTTSYQLKNAPEKAIVEVVAVDYAWNFADDTAAIGDVDLPIVFADDNATVPYGAYNTFEVPVAGYVTDDIGVKAIKVNGKEVAFSRNSKGQYAFSTTVTYDKDGAYAITVEAIDHSNKSFAIARHIYIDTTAPVINVTAPERVDLDVKEVTLDVNLQDNYNYLNFFVGEDHEFEVPFKSPVDGLIPLNKDYQVTVPLVEGENVVTLRATDLSGNETVKEVVINRADEQPVIQTGWVEENGVWYLYNEDGSLYTGWYTEEYEEGYGATYYFNLVTGAMQTGWLELDGNRYHFTEDGAMETDFTYVPESKNVFFFDENGVAQTGLQEMYGDYAYFDAKTGLLKNSWKLVDGNWYLADKYGSLEIGWAQDKGGVWYYFNQEAKMQTGWVHDGKSWYYLNKSGAMATGWVKDGGTWYYLNKSGAMATGWVLDNGKWYYTNSNGSMVANGWKLISGNWYYFYSSGVMAADTKIGGYKIGKNGAWIK